MKTNTETLIKALHILANDIESEDGVANVVIAEAADQLEELNQLLSQEWGRLNQEIDTDVHYGHSRSYLLSDSLEIDHEVPYWVTSEVKKLESINSELLNALEHAVSIYGRFGGVVNEPSSPGKWIEKAKSAIAVAKGIKLC